MSDVIRRRADGSWGQGEPAPTYASDHSVSTQAWLKEIGAESPDAELKKRIAKLEREVQEYKAKEM